MMTREVKVGLMMIAILVGVFGFLVYQRIHRPAELRAGSGQEQDAASELESITNDRTEVTNDDQAVDDQTVEELEPAQFERAVKRPARTDFEEIADEAADEDLAQVESKVLEQRLENVSRRPDNLSSVSDDESQPAASWNSSSRTREIEQAEPIENEIDDQSAPPVLARQSVSRKNADLPDPFDNGPSIHVEAKEESGSEAIRQVKSESQSYELPVVDEESVELPTLESNERSDTVDSDNARRNGSTRRRAAAVNSSFDADPSTNEKVVGETYTVQPSDSFWTISRKRYGAGRFYMALALHNRKSVPDPKKMRPGVIISTPDVSVLEQNYPESIPKLPADFSENSTQNRQSTDTERSGYFIGDDGEPMYRVGPKDTLTDIAKSHLNRSSRWVQILQMNRNVLRDGNELKVGTVLRLPADASRVRVAESSNNFR